jgi:hypothetical protein
MKCKKAFLGDQPCNNSVVIQRFGNCISFHRKGWWWQPGWPLSAPSDPQWLDITQLFTVNVVYSCWFLHLGSKFSPQRSTFVSSQFLPPPQFFICLFRYSFSYYCWIRSDAPTAFPICHSCYLNALYLYPDNWGTCILSRCFVLVASNLFCACTVFKLILLYSWNKRANKQCCRPQTRYVA